MISKLKSVVLHYKPKSYQVLINFSWLMAEQLLRLGAGLIVGIQVARYLGPDQYGLLNYAMSFVILFTTISTLGLSSIVVRDLVTSPKSTHQILGTTLVLRLVGGLIACFLAIGAMMFIRPGDSLTGVLVALSAAGLVVQAFDTLGLWYQAQTQSKYVVLAKSSAFFLTSVAKIGMILLQAPLVAFAIAGFVELVIGAIWLLNIYQRQGHTLLQWRFSLSQAKHLLSDSWTDIFSGMAILVFLRIDQTMLGDMVSSVAVGIYAAASRLSEIWYFIPGAIISSLLPTMVKQKSQDEAQYYRQLDALFHLGAGLAYLIVLPITFFAQSIVLMLFGEEYAEAGLILKIHIWAAPFVFLGTIQGIWNTAENLLKLSLQRTLIGAISNIALNFLLIPQYSGVGAAIATVVSYAASSVLMNVVDSRTRRIFWMQMRSLVFPSIPKMLMAIRATRILSEVSPP
jgi:polysaccharide transporter, PST family